MLTVFYGNLKTHPDISIGEHKLSYIEFVIYGDILFFGMAIYPGGVWRLVLLICCVGFFCVNGLILQLKINFFANFDLFVDIFNGKLG